MNPITFLRLVLLNTLSILILVGCNLPADTSVAAHPVETIESHENISTSVLLQEYWQRRLVKDGELLDTKGMAYLPRKFAAGLILHPTRKQNPVRVIDPGIFSGWDVLSTVNRPQANKRYDPDMGYLYLKLKRPSTVGIILYDSKSNAPRWLSDWTHKGNVEVDYGRRSYPVFTKALREGKHYLKPLGQKGLMYSVLFAEASGLPSEAPPVPEGFEMPEANKPCPAWVHDSYREGDHATWHPQIDPTYWCTFGHDHGSNPAKFAGNAKPVFDRYADATGHHEEHEGFKVIVLNENHHSVMITFHAGSSGSRRLCARSHAFDIVFAVRSTGEIVGNFAFKGDFGPSRAQKGPGEIGTMAPTECPENIFIKDSAGSRSVPIYPETGYESWRVDLTNAAALPLTGGGSFKIDEALTVCSNSQDIDKLYTCDHLITIPEHSGARHWFDLFEGFGMDTTPARGPSGRFCTDYLGAELMDCKDPKAVSQYAKPGTRIRLPDIRAFIRDPWGADYRSTGTFVRTHLNLEQSLSSQN